MNLIPLIISGITHPLIRQVYVKEACQPRHKPEHVLVIRTTLDRDTEVASEDEILSLFEELPKIKTLARRQSGNDIERLEIRYN